MRFGLLGVLGLLGGCTSVIGGAPAPSDDGSSATTAADAARSAGETAVARGMQWVAAEVPYCQAANHQPDGDSSCSPTCERPDNPAWDAYRSDCSGFVSWAWGLPAPGRTTATLAPFDMSVSIGIAAADLQPGDAINNDTHTMLFVGWTNGDMTQAQLMEEPGCSASQPYAREVTAAVAIDATMPQGLAVTGYGTFTAIRRQ